MDQQGHLINFWLFIWASSLKAFSDALLSSLCDSMSVAAMSIGSLGQIPLPPPLTERWGRAAVSPTKLPSVCPLPQSLRHRWLLQGCIISISVISHRQSPEDDHFEILFMKNTSYSGRVLVKDQHCQGQQSWVDLIPLPEYWVVSQGKALIAGL